MADNQSSDNAYPEEFGKKRVTASTAYDFHISSVSGRQQAQWELKFSQSLDYWMYPSLNVRPSSSPTEGSPNSRPSRKPSPSFGMELPSIKDASSDGPSPTSPSYGLSFTDSKDKAVEKEHDPQKLEFKWKLKVVEKSRGGGVVVPRAAGDGLPPGSPSNKPQSPSDRRALLHEQGTFDHDVQVRGEESLRQDLRDSYEAQLEAERQAKADEMARKRRQERFAGTVIAEVEKKKEAGRRRHQPQMSIDHTTVQKELSSFNVYSKLRADAKKKKTMNDMFGVVELTENDEARVYMQQKAIISSKLGPDDVYSAEGLLYYRMNYELEEQRREAEANLEPVAMRDTPFADSAGIPPSSMGLSVDPEDSRFSGLGQLGSVASQGSPLRVLRAHRDAKRAVGLIESDLSQMNLSGLQRAMSVLNATSTVATLRGADLYAAPGNGVVPWGSDGLGGLEDGGHGTSAATAEHAPRRSPSGLPVAVSSARAGGGLGSGGGEASDQGSGSGSHVSGTTRKAQDKLAMAQLAAGQLPESFIRRSANLQFADIDLSGYSLGDPQGVCLGKAIRGFDSLRRLALTENRFTGVSVSVIMKNAPAASLQELVLTSNNLRNQGAIAVAGYLSSDNTLRVLSLAGCNLRCEDVVTLSHTIAKGHSPHLTDLDLSRNEIAVDGASALADILRGSRGGGGGGAAGGGAGVTPSVPSCSSRLKSLNLAWNSVGTPGALVMAMALETNNVLCVLSLSANAVGDAAGQRLADMLMVGFLFFVCSCVRLFVSCFLLWGLGWSRVEYLALAAG